jgi:hypothetical protein
VPGQQAVGDSLMAAAMAGRSAKQLRKQLICRAPVLRRRTADLENDQDRRFSTGV